jgi:Sulfotransferase family
MIRRLRARRGASKAAAGDAARAARVPRWAQPIEVPECPEGWSTGPPDFVGIGAQRSGTSWWYRGIEAHPRVVRMEGQRKELHYFNRFWTGEVPPDFAQRYHSLFPRPPGALTGEWTPRYMHDFWSVPLLAEAAPAARVLVILRDPVERYRSGAARMVRLAEELDRPLRLVEIADALWRSFYFEQLSRVFELYPRERVLVLQFERCRTDPEAQMQATCRFLGLEPFAELPRQLVRERSPRDKPALPDRMRGELVARLTHDVARLVELCPEIDLALWPNFRHLAEPAAADREAGLGHRPRG